MRMKVLTVSGIVRANFDAPLRVGFAQRTYLCSYNQMMWSAAHHVGYPVTPYEVKNISNVIWHMLWDIIVEFRI